MHSWTETCKQLRSQSHGRKRERGKKKDNREAHFTNYLYLSQQNKWKRSSLGNWADKSVQIIDKLQKPELQPNHVSMRHIEI